MTTAQTIACGLVAAYLIWAIYCTFTGRNIFGKKNGKGE